MVINVKISLCKITAASKLFQRNYYLPLLKPLSPKDALRRKIITGQNVLGARVEHYIPVLTKSEEKIADRKKRGKGVPVIKKRVKKKESERYVEPFIDENMENHAMFQRMLNKKGKGKEQKYIYEVIDKNCNLVVNWHIEKCLKDKDIVDIVIAQRSEKIVCKLKTGVKVTLPIAPYEGGYPLYRGSGWTKDYVEEEHHHGKETMSIAKLFEAKESGVQDWELEMMRMANKRKKKVKGEDSGDWKAMMTGCLDGMDWNKFEDDSKQIVEESNDIVEDEDIPMAVDDMEKTTNVAEKLMAGGSVVLDQLPVMKEIPEVIKNLETGDLCEMMNVSGAKVKLNSGKVCFVTGQMVKQPETNEVFVPGQTVYQEETDTSDYTPGVTIYMDGEVTLIPGLVMGEDNSSAMFLPGESKITDDGQLKFEATADDGPGGRRRKTPSPSPPKEIPKPKPKPVYPEEIVIKRRVVEEPPEEPPKKERVKKRAPPPEVKPEPQVIRIEPFRPQRQPLDDPLLLLEQRRQELAEEERKRQKGQVVEKILYEEGKVDKLRMNMRKKVKDFKVERPGPYVPLDPVEKSESLQEIENSIKKGTFFDDEKTKAILEEAKKQTRMLKYQHVLNAYPREFGRRF